MGKNTRGGTEKVSMEGQEEEEEGVYRGRGGRMERREGEKPERRRDGEAEGWREAEWEDGEIEGGEMDGAKMEGEREMMERRKRGRE